MARGRARSWTPSPALTTGDNPIQILLATHSPELLNYLDPEEVRFVSRDRESGETKIVTPPASDTESWKKLYDAYDESLGEIWLSGTLGGVPGMSAAE